MLGRRDPQRTLFDANAMPHRVAAHSFYGRMAAVCDLLFQDDDLKALYDPNNGRPSLPPSLMSGVLLLQFFDDVSDQEAAERVLFDLRWKIALHLPLDYPGFDPSSLSYFRKRLAEHGQERYAFDRFVQIGRQAGFLPDRVTLLTDTTWVKGAGAVQDTYTLLRKGIRKVLRTLGYAVPGKRHGLAPEVQQLLASYLDKDRKADIDWTDPQQRASQLKVLVQDADAVLDLAAAQVEDPEVRSAGWMLTKILGDDVVTDEYGDPQIGEGTAPDRIISVTDPAMRHGHKSKAQRFDGFKTAVATEVESELILDVADLPATSGDGEPLMPTVSRIEAQAGVTVERVIGDGAYPSGQNLAACATHEPAPIDLVGPLTRPADPEVAKSAFHLDLEAKQAICPEGHAVNGTVARTHGQPALQFRFKRKLCEVCRLFARCVHGKVQGRTITTDDYERYRQRARQRQATPEFRELYRKRSRVERKQAELVRHGLRHTRYLGKAKRSLQRLWTAAVVNLKRLFRLAERRGSALRPLLIAVG
jgi:transposase